MSPENRTGARLGWLDALRGIAAVTVALHHFGLRLLIPYGMTVAHHFDLGIFGVMLFFLVSGYIVPASLERRGDVRAFWVGRLFRIYPVLALVVVAAVVVLPTTETMINPGLYQHPLFLIPANGLMLQDMLGVSSVVSVMWTLCYEMVFYYLVTALFAFGRHRQSGPIAVGFAAGALLLGAWLVPVSLSVDATSTRHLILAAGAVVVAGLAGSLSANRSLVRIGGLLLGGTGLVLALANGRSAPFETFMIFATMFAGTVIHRVERGQIGRGLATFCCGFVLVAGLLCAWIYDRGGDALARTWTPHWTAWALAYLAAWVAFGSAWFLRHRSFPRVLTWLGAISYSVYLLHWLVIDALDWQFGMSWLFKGTPGPHSVGLRVLLTVGFLAAVLVLSYLTYRLIELPGQRLGRRLLGSDGPAWAGPVGRRKDAGGAPSGRVVGRGRAESLRGVR